MPRKPKPPIDYMEALRKLQHAGISESPTINRRSLHVDDLPTLRERVRKLMGIINSSNHKADCMLFFVMYDIESDKVRYNVVKYLERMGCMRIQKSIFLADLASEKYHRIQEDLAEIQSLYDNHDSIILCPISNSLLESMKIIGKSIDVDIITGSKNTLFF